MVDDPLLSLSLQLFANNPSTPTRRSRRIHHQNVSRFPLSIVTTYISTYTIFVSQNSKHQTLRNNKVKLKQKILSGLIDMWTSEVKKMRNDKGHTNGSNPCEPDSPKTNQVIQHWAWSEALLKRVNSPPLAFPVYSEASVSMLVECFSP
ncbi:hypothetical protein L2E82_25264 [Cichorium intybus]|uniref:Uncharacterized protein n=1 Tax=Cichorium intybus TaxID=13427 RepID=A0ACB9E2J7_CICIN|nr:hypothetical protein L2E82_25264 [Cichorium intybus]